MITLEFASDVIDRAISSGAQQAEFFLKTSKNLSIEVKDQKINTLETSISYGYAVRLIKDNRLGFSYSTDIKEVNTVVDNALDSAKYAEPDSFLDMPSYERPSTVEVYDKNVAMISENEAIENILLMEQAAFNKDRRIKRTRNASGNFTTMETFIFNSQGIALNYISTGCTAQIMAIAENASENQMGWDFCGSRFLENIDFERTGDTAAKKALDLLDSRRITSLKGFILLDSSVAVDFLTLLSSALSAESVQKGKSLFANRMGQRVCNERFNIIDNGVLNRMLGSRPFDDEGVPTQNKILIEKGVLRTFLYNTYTARKDGLYSTGNALRGGFHNLPSVSPTNMYIEAADAEIVQNFSQLYKGIDKGIYVFETMGMHTANPISGEFSIGISGLWIENGEFKHPVKEAVISGNILDLFNKVVQIGDDLRFYGNIGSPSLLIEGIDISG